MPYSPKLFFRVRRGPWFVQVDGCQVNFGPDRHEAFRRHHELMARDRDRPQIPAGNLVVTILDAFFDGCQKHRAPRTYDWYRDYLRSFARSIPRDFVVERLRPIHVQQWVDAQPG